MAEETIKVKALRPFYKAGFELVKEGATATLPKSDALQAIGSGKAEEAAPAKKAAASE